LRFGLIEDTSSVSKILKTSVILKAAIPAVILAAGLLLASVTPSYAKPEYAKTEGKACTFCHVTAGKPDLNEAGNYYAAHQHSLKGYTPAKQ
jgi:hypothetical protein